MPASGPNRVTPCSWPTSAERAPLWSMIRSSSVTNAPSRADQRSWKSPPCWSTDQTVPVPSTTASLMPWGDCQISPRVSVLTGSMAAMVPRSRSTRNTSSPWCSTAVASPGVTRRWPEVRMLDRSKETSSPLVRLVTISRPAYCATSRTLPGAATSIRASGRPVAGLTWITSPEGLSENQVSPSPMSTDVRLRPVPNRAPAMSDPATTSTDSSAVPRAERWRLRTPFFTRPLSNEPTTRPPPARVRGRRPAGRRAAGRARTTGRDRCRSAARWCGWGR